MKYISWVLAHCVYYLIPQTSFLFEGRLLQCQLLGSTSCFSAYFIRCSRRQSKQYSMLKHLSCCKISPKFPVPFLNFPYSFNELLSARAIHIKPQIIVDSGDKQDRNKCIILLHNLSLLPWNQLQGQVPPQISLSTWAQVCICPRIFCDSLKLLRRALWVH